MDRRDAEDIVDGGPLGGGHDRMVDRIIEAVDAVAVYEYNKGLDCGFAAGNSEGICEGHGDGMDDERSRIIQFLDKSQSSAWAHGSAVEYAGWLVEQIRAGEHLDSAPLDLSNLKATAK